MPKSSRMLAGAALLLAGGCAPEPRFKPVGSVKQLMQATVGPSSEVVFEAVGTVVTASGTEEIAPKNDAEWTAVRNSAMALAESGNLLMIGDRARDKRDWMKMSRELVEAGVVAWQAAESRNPAALFEAGGKVYEVCERCHSRYVIEGQNGEKR